MSLSPRQCASLAAIVDGILPPIKPPKSSCQDDDVKKYWEYHLSEDLQFMQALQDTIQNKLRTKQEQRLVLLLLYLLSTRFGTFVLFGIVYFAQHPCVAFCDLSSSADRTRALQFHLQQSMWSPRRRIFNSFKRLILGLAFTYVGPDKSKLDPATSGESIPTSTVETNPFWKAMQYRGPPQQWTNRESNWQDSKRVELAMKQLESLNNHLLNPHTPLLHTNTDAGNRCLELECDVVVVGSGCGGSVAAFELAKAGYDVIVVEQGKYVLPSNVSNLEVDALDQMYDSHALLTTEDGNIVVVAGATIGGGSSINWSCCLPLPAHVKQEWVADHGLDQFKTDGAFDASMKHMMTLMTNDDIASVENNSMNNVFQKGCEAMGFEWETTGQNLEHTADSAAGYISLGDRYANKRSATATFLNPAVGLYNTRILEQCYVEKVLTRRANVTGKTVCGEPVSTPSLEAVGVSCRTTSASSTGDDICVEIRSRKRVIVAAGSLHSPCLLLRSGLRNRHIGRHLHLYPVTAAFGRFKQPIDFYLGSPMTTVCNALQMGPSENGYGCKIETPSAHPGFAAVAMPYTTPEQIKERMSHFSRLVPLIVIQRDGGKGGRVRCHPENGLPMIDYALNASDRRSMIEGLKAVVQILARAGAQEIGTCHYKDAGWNASPDADNKEGSPPMAKYLDSISQRGMGLHDCGIFSAHQMSTCRMSINPSQGAIDQNGETWECKDLFIMDASTFPTASGANPMMVILAMAHMLSTRLASKLDAEKEPTDVESG